MSGTVRLAGTTGGPGGARVALTKSLVAVLAAGALARMAMLGRAELWADEGYSALLARASSVREIVAELSRDSSPPLYYTLLHFIRPLAGGDDAGVRALSAVAGTLTLYATYRLAASLYSHHTALLATLLLAVSPIHVYYSQEARPYALLTLFALVALLGLRRMAGGETSRGAAVYCLGTIAAAYTHNYGLFLLVPLAAAAIARRVAAPLAALGGAAVALLYLPWLPILAGQVATGAAQWTERIWLETPPSAALLRTAAAFSIGGDVPPWVPIGLSRLPSWVNAIAYALFGALVLRALWSRRAGAATSCVVAVCLLALLGVPYAISFALPIYVAGRYDVVGLPLFLILCAAGADGLSRRETLAVGAIVVALAAASLTMYYTREPQRGARLQAAIIAANTGETDAVLAMGFTRNALEYYVREAGGAVPFHSFPSSLDVHRGWMDERQLESREATHRDARAVVRKLAAADALKGRLWVVHSSLLGNASRVLLARLNERFAPLPCPDDGERMGLSCWVRVAGRP